MTKRPIRDLHSDTRSQKRFCDVVIDGDEIYLEKKVGRNGYEIIAWKDVVYQVDAAKEIDTEI